jgi:hypothetical protein
MRHDIILMVGKFSPKLFPKGIELLRRNADSHHGNSTLPVDVGKDCCPRFG